jgi:hypothetical protein
MQLTAFKPLHAHVEFHALLLAFERLFKGLVSRKDKCDVLEAIA